MDNITHLTLGGTLGGLTSFRKLGKKAFYRGMLLGNVPDLDVIVGPLLYGTGIDAEFFHRGMFHSILFGLFIGPILASIINRFHKGNRTTLWTWTLVAWICIGSHLFLDLLTSYGTQILRPFSNVPYSLNAIFIIDPFYTIPFVVLFVAALFAKKIRNTVRLSATGLLISSVYLLMSFGVKLYMNHVFTQSADVQGIHYTQFVTSPEALQILLRKGMLINSGHIYQGWHSVLDNSTAIQFRATDRKPELLAFMSGDVLVKTLIRRSRGYYTASGGTGGVVYLNDMRFGTINGWTSTGDTFMYSYALMHSGSGVTLLPWSRNFGKNIDAHAFRVLFDRIGGI